MRGGSCATSVVTSWGVCPHERERGHSAPAAGEHLHRPDAECLDNRVHVARLHGGCVVDPAVLTNTPAEASGVIGDHGAVGEERCQGLEAAGFHRPIMNNGGRPLGAGSWPRTS